MEVRHHDGRTAQQTHAVCDESFLLLGLTVAIFQACLCPVRLLTVISSLVSVVSFAVTRGPFPQQLIKEALFRARGDMVAGEIKAVKEVDTVKAELPLLVSQEEAPDVYKLAQDDAVEIGPFVVRNLSLHL